MRLDTKKLGLFALMANIVFLFIITILNRDSGTSNTIKLDLFWGYNNPPEYIYRDNLLNIASFVPIGVLVGLTFKKHRVLKALLVGLLVSLVIECSQLIWSRGTFDVDDLFNNSLGALVGGGIYSSLIMIKKRRIEDKDTIKSRMQS